MSRFPTLVPMFKFPVQLLDLLFLMYVLHHGPPTVSWQRAALQATGGKITVSDVPNRLNYCVVFMVYTEFTNVAVGCIIQHGGPMWPMCLCWIPMFYVFYPSHPCGLHHPDCI
jgi:hypothetical protein